LGGLAALPAILSGNYQIKSYPRSWEPRESDKGSNDDQLRRPTRQKSRPDQGLIKVRTTMLNQSEEAVRVLVANLIAPRRDR
jgi:hypothetical protein